MNPFKDNPFRNLSKPQKYMVAGGVVLLGGFVVWRHHSQTGSWNPWSGGNANASGNANSSAIDPITGLPYSMDNQVDPITSLTYLAEAEQYGSVATAEASVSAYGTSSGTGSGIGVSPASPGNGSSTPPPSDAYASNQDWVQAVQAGLTDLGYAETTTNAAIQGYLANQPLPAQEYRLMKTALSEFGPPPNGSFQLLQAPASAPGKSKVTVPDVTGLDVEQASGIIRQVGLKPSGPAGVKGKIHKVTSTSPAKGKDANQGETVTLHYETVNEGKPVLPGKGI